MSKPKVEFGVIDSTTHGKGVIITAPGSMPSLASRIPNNWAMIFIYPWSERTYVQIGAVHHII